MQHSTPQDCRDTITIAKRPMGEFKPIFPAPGGGIKLETIPDLLSFYDRDVIFIMGGGLHEDHALIENSRKFREMVQGDNVSQ